MSARAGLAASVLLASLSLAACGGSGGEAKRPTTTTSYPLRHAAALPGATVTILGKDYAVPTEDGGQLPSQGQSIGTQVVIRNDGVLPETLIAPEGAVITWTNLSDGPASVHFLTGGMKDAVDIPVGGTFTYTTPGRYNFAFRTSTHGQGTVYVGAFGGNGA